MSPPSTPWLDQLPPVLRALLLSDGTVTKFLEAWYREPVRIVTLLHAESPLAEDLPPLEVKKGAPVLRRRIQMFGGTTNQLFGVAESFIRADTLWPDVSDDLVQGRLGIGELMRERRIETYRELLSCEPVPAGPWAAELDCAADAPIAARTYRIFIAGQPGLFITDRYVIERFG